MLAGLLLKTHMLVNCFDLPIFLRTVRERQENLIRANLNRNLSTPIEDRVGGNLPFIKRTDRTLLDDSIGTHCEDFL